MTEAISILCGREQGCVYFTTVLLSAWTCQTNPAWGGREAHLSPSEVCCWKPKPKTQVCSLRARCGEFLPLSHITP